MCRTALFLGCAVLGLTCPAIFIEKPFAMSGGDYRYVDGAGWEGRRAIVFESESPCRGKCPSVELDLKPGRMGLIVNRAPDGKLDDGVLEEIRKHGLELLGVLPQDDGVYRCDCAGEPSAKLPQENPVKVALRGILQSIGL